MYDISRYGRYKTELYKSFLTYQNEFSVGLVSSKIFGAIAAIFQWRHSIHDLRPIILCEELIEQRTHGDVKLEQTTFHFRMT